MRVISNAKAREGKNTFYRMCLAAYLWDRRNFGSCIDRFDNPHNCSWGISPLMVYKGLGMYFTEICCHLKERKETHISFSALKKGCKRKTEQVWILLA